MLPNSEYSSNNKRILKNTFVLYIRMGCTMFVGFFTTRELLLALGVVDFGLVNVIGSIVTMFSFLSGIMQATVARYFSYELGRKDYIKLNKIFNLSLLIYITLGIIILLLAQTVGVWFLERFLTLPPERKYFAGLFFQFSVSSFIFGILSIPYSALIIAREDFKALSWISIGESIARLAIVYFLYESDFDRLVFYGSLLCAVTGIMLITYIVYCHKKYPESLFGFYWDRTLCIEMLSFAGWNLWGAISGLFSNVLVNVLLNNYFGAGVNAARGIAMQGATGVSSFVTNFLTATRPQIFKYYAEKKYSQSIDLTINAAKTGYFLLLFFAIPVLCEMESILQVWLKEAPEYASLFMRLILIQKLIEILTHPLVTLSQATGRIAAYQTVVGILQCLILPLSWISLKLGGGPDAPFWISIITSILALISQCYLINRIVENFSMRFFLQNAILPTTITTIASGTIPIIISTTVEASAYRFILTCVFSAILTSISIYYIGLNKYERESVISFLKGKIKIR